MASKLAPAISPYASPGLQPACNKPRTHSITHSVSKWPGAWPSQRLTVQRVHTVRRNGQTCVLLCSAISQNCSGAHPAPAPHRPLGPVRGGAIGKRAGYARLPARPPCGRAQPANQAGSAPQQLGELPTQLPACFTMPTTEPHPSMMLIIGCSLLPQNGPTPGDQSIAALQCDPYRCSWTTDDRATLKR